MILQQIVEEHRCRHPEVDALGYYRAGNKIRKKMTEEAHARYE